MEFLYVGLFLATVWHLDAAQVRTLKVSTIKTPPYVESGRDRDGNITYRGFIPDLLDLLRKTVSFDYKIIVANDFGELLPNGSWTGMIGQVARGEADLAAGPLTVTKSRSEAVDFTQPIQSVGPVIVMKRPQTGGGPIYERLAKLLSPMEFSVWLMSVVAYLTTSTVLYAIAHFNPYEWRRMYRDREATLREAESFNCINSFWFVLSTWAWQGYTRAPRSMGGRISITFWWLFVIIFLSTYTASLTNLLRVGLHPDEVEHYSKVNNLEDLLYETDVRYGILKGGSTEQMFQSSSIKYMQKLYHKMLSHRKSALLRSVPAGVQRVRSAEIDKFAFIMESAMAKYYIQQDSCDLYFVSDFLVSRQYAIAFPKNTPLIHQFDSAILQLHESGDIMALEHKWFSGRCTSYEYSKTREQLYQLPTFDQVDLGTFSGAFFVLAVGLLVGGVVTMVEVFVFKTAEAPEQPNTPKTKTEAEHEDRQIPLASDSLIQQPDDSQARGVTTV